MKAREPGMRNRWQQKETQTNRNYKDSVFVDLFAHDETAKENFIFSYLKTHDLLPFQVLSVLLPQEKYHTRPLEWFLYRNNNHPYYEKRQKIKYKKERE